MQTYARAAAIVDLSRVAANVRATQALIGPRRLLMAVVKANGYGHGIYEVSKAAVDAGAHWLGVATVTEGVFLRRFGITAPILVLSPVFEEEFENVILNDLHSTFFQLESCQTLSKIAGYLERPAKIHIKIDTGMNRVGFNALDVRGSVDEILQIADLPNLRIGGIYSHFAASDSDHQFANEQFARFTNVLNALEERKLKIPLRHISNSGAVICHPEFGLDMVRCGVLTFGLAPCSTPQGAKHLTGIGILPALSLKSRVSHVKTVKAGESVGYSRNYLAKKDTAVASVTLGYADGLSRQLSNTGHVLINGHHCQIIGNICMDQFMVDVTGVPAKARDEVIIIGESEGAAITTEDISIPQKSINYEVITSISERVPRFYTSE